jgi:CRP-like cAMP-binding protein
LSEIVALLKRSHLGVGISDDELARIAELASPEGYRPGEQIWDIGARLTDLMIVAAGQVNVMTADADLLREVGPNGILGELPFVDGGPCHARFVAVQHSQIFRFPTNDLRAWLAGNRQVGFMFLANLSRLISIRLRQADGRIDTLMDLEREDLWENVL